MNQSFSWKITLIIGLCFVLLWGLWVAGPQGSGETSIVADHDAYLHMWNLWWVPKAVMNFHSPYVTNYIGYPGTADLTYHQLMLPLGVASIPFHWLGWTTGQILVFWQYTGMVTGYLGMSLLIIRLGGTLPGMLAGSIFFIINPLYWQNLARPDSLGYVLFPWVVLGVIHANRFRLAWFGSILLIASVLLMSPYHGVSLVLLWALAFPFISSWNWNYKRYAWLIPGALLVTSFHWIPQLFGNSPDPVRFSVVEAFSADLTAWLLPPSQIWWMGEGAWWTETWTATEPSLYPGWLVLALVVVGWGKIPRQYRFPATMITAVFFILSLGPSLRIFGESYGSGLLPYGWGWNLFDSVKAFRTPLRFAFPIFFLISLALGLLLPSDKKWTQLFIPLMIIELSVMPISVKSLPAPEPLRNLRSEISKQALIGVPLTDWPTEVQYSQTLHEKKLPLLGRSYGTESLWNKVSSQPVLNAFYRQEPLPANDNPWQELKRNGYAGVLLHTISLGTNHPEILQTWKTQLQNRFGPPNQSTDHWELYRFK